MRNVKMRSDARYGLAVGERGLLVEVKAVHETIGRNLPCVREGRNRLQVAVEVDDGREDVLRDEAVDAARGDEGVERDDVHFKAAPKRSAVYDRLSGTCLCASRACGTLIARAARDAEHQQYEHGATSHG